MDFRWRCRHVRFDVLILAVLVGAQLTVQARDVSATAPCPEVSGATIQWVVPHAVGGGYDTYSRFIAPFLERALGAQIVVWNRSGAGGTIGAAAIHAARPDGRTIGILNGSGLMMKAMAGGERTPNPATDFTVLARVARSQQIWAAAKESPFKTIEDVLEAGETRPILFGMRDVGSTSFVNVSVTSHLLGLNTDIVAGYKGTQAKGLAALRGEVDLVAGTFETLLAQIENKDLRPILQVADAPIEPHPALEGVPLLGGEDGWAAKRAERTGRHVDHAIRDASALAGLLGAGRLIVAPPGMDKELSGCMKKTLLSVLRDPELVRVSKEAGRSLDVTDGATAQAELLGVAHTAAKFMPIVERSIVKVRE